MKEICPYCMNHKEVKVINFKEEIPFQEAMINVETKTLECLSCGTKFNNKDYPNNAVELAFKKYNEQYNR